MKLLPLLTLALVTFALGFGELMIAAILPPIARDLRVSVPLAGQLVTVYAASFALLSGPLAVAARRISPHATLVAALLSVAVANLAAAAAPAFGLLIGARILAAVGSAVATPLALAAVDGAAGKAAGRAHGIVFTGFSLAAMLGVPLGALIAAGFGWRWTFGFVALLAACAAGLVWRVLPRSPAAIGEAAGLAGILRRAAIRSTLAASLLVLAAQYTVFTYFRPYFVHASGAGIGEIVWLFFVYGIFGIVGTLLAGIAVDRWGARPLLLVTVAGCGLSFAALPLMGRTPIGSTVDVIAWALASWGFSPAVNRQLDRDAGAARDVALALNLTAFNIGIAAGSAAGGAVIASAGIGALPIPAAILCALALIFITRRVP